MTDRARLNFLTDQAIAAFNRAESLRRLAEAACVESARALLEAHAELARVQAEGFARLSVEEQTVAAELDAIPSTTGDSEPPLAGQPTWALLSNLDSLPLRGGQFDGAVGLFPKALGNGSVMHFGGSAYVRQDDVGVFVSPESLP